MKRRDKAFRAFEAKARERDLSPAQCRAGRELLGWDRDDLEHGGCDADDIEAFETDADDQRNLSICERFRIIEAFRAAGVSFYRRGAAEGVRISRSRPDDPSSNDGPSPAQCRAARALLDWDLSGLADLSGIAIPEIEAFEAGGELRTDDRVRLVAAFRAAGATFYWPKTGEGVWVKCRRPWYRAWLERRSPEFQAWLDQKARR